MIIQTIYHSSMVTLLPILLLVLAETGAESAKLLQVQIVSWSLIFDLLTIEVPQIIRHADRAPIHEFTSPESAKLFPRGLGEITRVSITNFVFFSLFNAKFIFQEGLHHATQQGAAFRQYYTEQGLLSDKTKDNEVFKIISNILMISSPLSNVIYFLLTALLFRRIFTISCVHH